MTLHTSPHSKAILTLADFTVPLPRLHDILAAVCKVTGFTYLELTSPRRFARYCDARQIYYGLARNLTKQSWPRISYYCGGRDHNTAMHGYDMFVLRCAAEPDFNREVKTVEKLLAPK